MHTEVCESCRTRPAVWAIEFDQDLDLPERVRFNACDTCIVAVDKTDPNMTMHWLGDEPELGVGVFRYGVVKMVDGGWVGFIDYPDGVQDIVTLPSYPLGYPSEAEAKEALVPGMTAAVERAIAEMPGVELLDSIDLSEEAS